MFKKTRFFIIVLAASLAFLLTACTPETVTVVETVEVVREVEGEPVTVIETVVVEVEKPTEAHPKNPIS